MAFLSARELQQQLHITRGTLLRWLRMGLPRTQVGPRRWLYNQVAVATWLRQEYPEYDNWLRECGFPEEIQNG